MKNSVFRVFVGGAVMILASATFAEGPGRGAPPPLTDEQAECIVSKGGNLPGEQGPPPSAEVFEACGLKPPPGPPPHDQPPGDEPRS